MRRKEDIQQSMWLRVAFTAMLFLVGLILYILPGKDQFWTRLLFLPFVFSVFAGVFLGTLPGLLLGVLIPGTACLLLKQLDPVPDGIVDAISLGISGLVAGIFYNRFKTGFGAALGALLIYLPVCALTSAIINLLSTTSYELLDFVREGVLEVHAGLVLPIVLVPLFLLIFRKSGLMELLRGEPRD